MNRNQAPLVRAFRFLGSVRFTTLLLLGGAGVMTVGTVVESRAGRELAWSTIYGTAWFDVFLFLIGVNLVVAVVNRIPIRRQQWPFVVTHAAIVLLLAGAWISRSYGYEGRMIVFEGGEESRILLDASELRVRWRPEATAPGHGGAAPLEAVFPLPVGGRVGAVLQEEGQGRPGLRVAEYVSEGAVDVDLREGGRGGVPGVEIRLVTGDQEVREWLLAGDPRFGRKDLGFLEVAFAALPPDAALEEATAFADDGGAAVVVSARGGGAPIRLPVPASMGDDLPCGAGVVARVLRFLIRARVVDGELVEAATGPLNPAAVVEIRSGMRRELHTVFARMPEVQKVEGRDEARPLVASVGLEASTLATRPRLSLLLAARESLAAHESSGPDERLYVVLAGVAHRSPAVLVREGGSVALEVLGAELRVERLLRSARPEVRVRASAGGRGDGRAFLRLEATRGGETASSWLARGGGWSGIALDGSGRVEASFGPRSRPLPFAVALHEFEVVHHPGSTRPAEYRSVVEVKPAGTALQPREAVISMNRPLDVLGFRLFQSSYQLGRDGGPDATVLSVSRDPGVPIVYTSFALLIVGIAWGLRGVRQKSDHWVAWVSGEQEQPGPEPTAGPAAAYADGARLRVGLWLALALLAGAAPGVADAAVPVEETRGWAILADGRVKPLQTHARETAVALTGRASLDGLSSLEILWGYALASQDFAGRPYLRVDDPGLKEALGLDPETKRFAFEGLVANARLRELSVRALRRREAGGEPSRLESQALEVYGRLDRVAGLASTEALRIVPIGGGGSADSWQGPARLRDSADPAARAVHDGFARLAAAYAGGDAAAFQREARELTRGLRALGPAVYPPESSLRRELFYVDFNAFGKAWKLYLAGFLVLLLVGLPGRRWSYAVGFSLVAAGFLCHSIGIGTRWAIAGRAPVSDMYESLVFMGWGAIAIALVPEALHRKRFLAMAAGLVGFLCLSLAENLPLDPAINPLVPVLAHTSWLSIHVMTIMLSYSAFALTMVLGHVVLFLEVADRGSGSTVGTLSKLLYKTLQVGVLFLAAGIAFGAIWANESWGRYWGWDPKETWSLITFFVYLAIIHARYAGWLRHFGLAVSAVLGFLAVVMTYYGVNFILASGLHAYGFSEGGQLYVLLFAAVEIGIVTAAGLRRLASRRRGPHAVPAPAAGA